MKKIVVFVLVVLMVISAFTLVSCSDQAEVPETPAVEQTDDTAEEPPAETPAEQADEASDATGEPIKVGNIQDTTGPTSTQGLSVQRGIELCIDDINAAGGINGAPIELISYDCAGDPEEALNCYKRLCEMDGVQIVLGPPLSNVGLACIEATNEYKVPFLGAFAINKCMINEDTGETNDYMFAVQPTAEYAGRILADYIINKLGYNKVAVLSRSDQAYLNASYNEFKNVFTENGGEIVSDQLVTKNDTDYKVQISNMISSDAEMLVHFLETNDNVLFFNQYNQLGGTLEVGGGNSFAQPMVSMLDNPESANGLYFTNNVDLDEAGLQDIAKAYNDAYGVEADTKTYVGYDLGLVLKAALEGASAYDAESIKASLETNINDIELCQGVFSFSDQHMPEGLSMVIFKIDGGEYSVLERYAPED